MKYVALVVLLLLSSGAFASETNWTVNLRLYAGDIGGAPQDIYNEFGTRPGATDGFDRWMDGPAPPPPPGPPYLFLSWYRSGWSFVDRYSSDFRAPIVPGQTKVWEGLGAYSCPGGPAVICWKPGWSIPLGSTDPNMMPPANYRFTLYDEGNSPNPEGGTPIEMGSGDRYYFGIPDGSIRHFHIKVEACLPERRVDVRLENIETRATIHLKRNRLTRIRVQVSSPEEAEVEVGLFRWRFKTSGSLDLIKIWSNLVLEGKKKIQLFYFYEKADSPEIKWKAMIRLLGNADTNPCNNVKFKTVKVRN